ncbi:torsin-3A isoform X1 [Trachemys scripta elegans]|uniref:torsin-3A isoform X1 n=1 Tax=Trachemys scripta elegans TaxID=31138 RepID=UPI00155697D0|nr:torsin-3A isoform X1 [Trachemys scripta elegans]
MARGAGLPLLLCCLGPLLCGAAAPGVPPGWSLPLVGQDYLEILSSWYCSFGKCCETGDCRIANNITGLELDLSRRLHGQHLAKDVILKAVQGFLETPQPEKALALSFHGWSGTGKNFVARMIADHLYRDGLKSECVKVFISLFHFPHPKYVDLYKVQLKKQISETVQLCKQSLFIFDEAEKLHSGLLDAIKPYVDHYDSIDEVDYRRSIFLFLSNIGGNIISQVTLDFWRAGRAREEITMEYLEQHLRLELLESTEGQVTGRGRPLQKWSSQQMQMQTPGKRECCHTRPSHKEASRGTTSVWPSTNRDTGGQVHIQCHSTYGVISTKILIIQWNMHKRAVSQCCMGAEWKKRCFEPQEFDLFLTLKLMRPIRIPTKAGHYQVRISWVGLQVGMSLSM